MSSTDLGAKIPDLADRLYHGMNRAIIGRLSQEGHADIRLPHAAVFETIGTGARISAMAERAGITKQSMGELVAYLEHRGYVTRERDPDDARAWLIQVTDRGRAAVDVAQCVIDEIIARWPAVASARQIEAASRTLARLVADVEAFSAD